MTAYKGATANYNDAPSCWPVCRQAGCTEPPARPQPTSPGDQDLCQTHLAKAQQRRHALAHDERGRLLPRRTRPVMTGEHGPHGRPV